MLVLTPGQKGASVGHTERARTVPALPAARPPAPSPSPSEPRLIPGGGSILFSTGQGVGVLEADGSVSHFGGWAAVDAFWDPVHPGQILVNPYTDGPPKLRGFRRAGDRWRAVRSWPAGYGGQTQISPDGRWLAFDVFVKGRATGMVRVTSRHGVVASIQGHFESVSWTSDERVILSRWDGPGLFLWDPFRDVLDPFTLDRNLSSQVPAGARRVSLDSRDLSWSSDGRLFAAPTFWKDARQSRSGVAVGSLADGILAVVPTGMTLAAPTWSPTRPEIAFVSSRRYGDPAAALY
ncbi:MAG TPA: hypothetical protein VGR13_04270, partial [Actinomycetota bacterium]|nr:hypothetical protein [Actinomycetota bacterium]